MLAVNNLDVAGLLQTYALKAQRIDNTKDLRKMIRDLREELDLRKVRC